MNTSAAPLAKSLTFAALPPIWPDELFESIRRATIASHHTLVVLDDDPTGTQTVYDVPVITRWDPATLQAELSHALPCFFILTNSRSLTGEAARALNLELARNLREASAATGRAFTLVSRSDSTLRGHYPVETDALAAVCGPFDATILVPYFEAGGRYTLGDIHYVAEDDTLTPAAYTPFARDSAFGYRSSDLRAWIEEKTAGRIPASTVHTISIELIRTGGPTAVTAALIALPKGSVCVVNACAPRDAEVFASASLAAEQMGKKFLYRTAASFVSARLGLAPRPVLTARELATNAHSGGLVMVGSYVPKTTAQLERLLALPYAPLAVPLDVASLLDPARRSGALIEAREKISAALAAGDDVVVFTSRELVTSSDPAASLEIGRQVSEALVTILRSLTLAPRFLIAKGGVTSSDLATRGLGVVRAQVLGQILPGVPVWELGRETRFAGLTYVVFPGNVGDADALAVAFSKFNPSSAFSSP